MVAQGCIGDFVEIALVVVVGIFEVFVTEFVDEMLEELDGAAGVEGIGLVICLGDAVELTEAFGVAHF